MALTKGQLVDIIEHAVDEISAELSAELIINNAGRMLIGMRSWNFLKAPTTTLDLTEDQGHVALPADFGGLIELTLSGTLGGRLIPATIDEIDARRSYSNIVMDPYSFLFAIASARSSDTEPLRPRIELYPTPTQDEDDALVLRYRAGWDPVESSDPDDWVPALPDYMDAVLTEMVRAVARGLEESDVLTTDQRVAQVAAGPSMQMAIRQDNRERKRYGGIRRGHLHGTGDHYPRHDHCYPDIEAGDISVQ